MYRYPVSGFSENRYMTSLSVDLRGSEEISGRLSKTLQLFYCFFPSQPMSGLDINICPIVRYQWKLTSDKYNGCPMGQVKKSEIQIATLILSMSLNFIQACRNDKWYNKRVLIWIFTLVLIKIKYGQKKRFNERKYQYLKYKNKNHSGPDT
jgi:hypothetical protein